MNSALVFLILVQQIDTPKHPVTETYHGVEVRDDYQWLEKTKSPEVKQWVEEENSATRAFLDKLPGRAAIEERLTKLYKDSSPVYGGLVSRQGLLFALKFQPPKQQPLLVTLQSADAPTGEKVVLDPNLLDPTGATAIDWFAPSLDGKYVAVSLSRGGGEEGTLRIYKTADGTALPDSIARVQYPTAGGGAAWSAEGVYYTRFPRKGERPDADLNFYQQVFFHKPGSPESEDVYSLGKDFPRIAEIKLAASRDGRFILATVANGDGGDYAHYILDVSAKNFEWRRITHFEDGVKEIAIGWDNALYLLSRDKAPRGKILRIPPGSAALGDAKTIVPESDAVIESVAPSERYLYVRDLVGGPNRLRRFGLEGGGETILATPPISAVQQVLPLDDGRVLVRNATYLQPYAWFTYDPGSGDSRKTALVGTSPVNFDDCEVVREFALSRDGTKVPVNIVRRKDCKLDGSNPALLYGYGGYGISLSPSFDATRRLWMDRGGVYAIANIRGGGEYGEEWHKAGNLVKKQNVFDDLTACAQHLIDAGYTRPAKLAIQGGSNGGLLMGAILTQHPGLVRAVVSSVGIYDSLRSELEPNGAFNVTEFGTVKDPAQFKALHAYSPYHHVTDGTKYPAILLLTGANDGRVAPHNSYKMAARLQAATASGLPVLLRVSTHSGHGVGTALGERIAQQADVFAFLFEELK